MFGIWIRANASYVGDARAAFAFTFAFALPRQPGDHRVDSIDMDLDLRAPGAGSSGTGAVDVTVTIIVGLCRVPILVAVGVRIVSA